jgi:pilus assembly protein CpaF
MLRAESNNHLDYRNPSLKTSLELNGIQLRFSVGIPPLSPNGLHLQIRRAATRPYSVLDLVMNNTMSGEIAAILLLAIASRMNITIVGEPGAGKTTLLNALDMTTPPLWRKIYIEDAVESRDYDNQHQLHIKVDSVDEINGLLSKTNEIVKSLHRSPDYLILGEIQTSDHSQALFQALAAGLRTMQTCHSGSASNLVTRWISVHNVPQSNVALMDLIVTVIRPKAGSSKRRVQEITEIRSDFVNGILEFKGLNRIFDYSTSRTDTKVWTPDGAFQHRMQEMDIENYGHLLKNITSVIQNHLSMPYTDIDLFLRQLWNEGCSLGI